MPQYPYLKVTERLGPVMNAQRLALRLMMRLREHQEAENHYLSNEFVNSHGLLHTLGHTDVTKDDGILQNINFTMKSLPKPLTYHGTLTITQAQFQQSTKLFTLKKYDGSGVALDVSESTNFACFKFPTTGETTEIIATQNYVTKVFNTNAGPTGAKGDKGDQGDQVTARTYNITVGGAGIYKIDGENNASIYLIRGQKYILSINASGHPFRIQTSSGAYNSSNEYSSGITNAGDIDNGIITFIVPYDAPDILYYVCEIHSAMNGSIIIKNLTGDSLIGNAGPTGVQGPRGSQGIQGPPGVNVWQESWSMSTEKEIVDVSNNYIYFQSFWVNADGNYTNIKFRCGSNTKSPGSGNQKLWQLYMKMVVYLRVVQERRLGITF